MAPDRCMHTPAQCRYNLCDLSTNGHQDHPDLNEEEGTFRMANGGVSLLDRWLIPDPLFTKGGLTAQVRKLWMSRLNVQHARLTLAVSNIEHENDDVLPAFEAIPFATLTRANPAFLELERRIDRLESERSAQAQTDKFHGVLSVSHTHLRAHETKAFLVCRLLFA